MFKISMQLFLKKPSYKLLNLDLDGRTARRTARRMAGRMAGRTPSLLEAPPASQGRLKILSNEYLIIFLLQ